MAACRIARLREALGGGVRLTRMAFKAAVFLRFRAPWLFGKRKVRSSLIMHAGGLEQRFGANRRWLGVNRRKSDASSRKRCNECGARAGRKRKTATRPPGATRRVSTALRSRRAGPLVPAADSAGPTELGNHLLQGGYPARMRVQTGNERQFASSNLQKRLPAAQPDLLQRLQTVRDKRRTNHEQFSNSVPGDSHQFLGGIGLQPGLTAEPRLKCDGIAHDTRFLHERFHRFEALGAISSRMRPGGLAQ